MLYGLKKRYEWLFKNDTFLPTTWPRAACTYFARVARQHRQLAGHRPTAGILLYKVAMQFAQNYPQSLSKLIVVDIAPRRYDLTKIAKGLQILQTNTAEQGTYPR